MKIRSTGKARWRCVLGPPEAAGANSRTPLETWENLAALGSGRLVQRARSSWVQIVTWNSTYVYAKTYVYPTAADRRRGWLRTTWLAPSRARREATALLWLRSHGFFAPAPLAVVEARRFGVLHAALLLTEPVEGEPLHQVLPRLAHSSQAAILRALRTHVTALHEAGFRDRNLDLRNILLVGDAAAPRFAKIDSPRHRLRRRGAGADSLTRADWRRLTDSLAELGLVWPDAPSEVDAG
ncbi:MAG: lipopolysaccharide kinase InaA family protein [Planctomycetota bacterium]